MLLSAAVLVVAAAALALAGDALKIEQHFVNDNCQRQLDVGRVLRDKRAIAITPSTDAPPPASGADYYFYVETYPYWAPNMTLASLTVKAKDVDTPLQETLVSNEDVDGRRTAVYKVRLDKPRERNILTVDAVFSHPAVPLPEEIAQNERQFLLLRTNAYLSSPYPTTKQKLKLTLPASKVESYSTEPQPVSKSGRTITYGPYENQPAIAFTELRAHFEHSSALLTIPKLTRELWISHWTGFLSVEEWYNLRHDGAKLKGQFSRVDYQSPSQSSSVILKALTLDLPPMAQDVYFRDDIGNVSTSNFRQEGSKRSVLELRPRYPICGGWNYTWYHGYNVPMAEYLRFDASEGRYIFHAQLVQSLPDTPINELQVHLPLVKMDSIELSKTFTYVDTLGRPTLLLTKFNVVDDHAVPFQVSYRYASSAMWRKPIVLSTSMLALFLLAMVCWRAEFTIKSAKVPVKAKTL